MTLDVAPRVRELESRIADLERELATLRSRVGDAPVADYHLTGWDGPVRLSGLFADRDRLIVIHNMGLSCLYCTMWADGFNGILPYLVERAAFAVASPDDPAEQRRGAEERGWRFRMVSTRGSRFARDMGFEDDDGGPMPGVSTFVKDPDGTMRRYAMAPFGPGDRFCAVWSFVDLLPESDGEIAR